MAEFLAKHRAYEYTDNEIVDQILEDLKKGNSAIHRYAADRSLWSALGVTIPEYSELNTWADRLAVAAQLSRGYPAVVEGNVILPNTEPETPQDFWDWVELQMAGRNTRLKTVSDMLATPEIEWMVEGRLHRSGLAQIYGPSYSGKTLLVLDLFLSWCSGLSHWQGLALNNGGEPQDGIYVAAEGGAALSVHVDAWLKHHPEVDPAVLDAHAAFLDGGDGHFMHLDIRAPGKRRDDEVTIPYEDSWEHLVEEVVGRNLEPSLLVFDTQIDLSPGIDENSNAEMVALLSRIKRDADRFGYMAVVVHHTGHDETRARGASGMKAKVDVQAQLSVENYHVYLKWHKVKGAMAPETTVDYQIKGRNLLPELESEGAVCVPYNWGGVAKVTGLIPPAEVKADILNFCLYEGGQPAIKIAEHIGVSRKSNDFTEWMKYLTRYGGELEKHGTGSATKYVCQSHEVR
ncbi:AAA family ATPase [Cellulosimicrobium funkei]|nr:AAA family ATPase [Cellulosimicrobium funkei]